MSDNGQLDLGTAHDLVRAGGLSSPHHGTSMGAFPPIADYAYLSDCEVGALVAPSGNVEWMCPPRFDAPSVFGSMLDRDAGRFRLSPADVLVPASRRYLPGTLVLETTWMTRTGWLIVYDFTFAAGHVGLLPALLLLVFLPLAYLSVQIMRWWGGVMALSQRPQFKRAET